MLIKRSVLEAIAAGSVSLAFRRWKRPTVRAGGRLRTALGELSIEAVDVVSLADIGELDARRAGFASRAALVEELRGREGRTYRIALRFAGRDPRAELRERSVLGDEELEEVLRRLARLDRASRHGAWTARALELIEDRPGVRASELAAEMELERDRFKRNVRKLKELGLTESLEIGYRLSPRGRAVRSALHGREAG